MPLQKETVSINFGAGLDTKTDPFQLPPNRFLAMNNSVFTTGKQLKKRFGRTELGTSVASVSGISYSAIPANLTDTRLVAEYNNELIVTDGFNLFSYNNSLTNWTYKGRSTLMSVASEQITSGLNGASYTDMSIDTVNNLRFYVWQDDVLGNAIRIAIQDTITGNLIVNEQSSTSLITTNGIKPRVVSVGGNSFVFYIDGATGHLVANKYIGSVFNSTITVFSDLNAGQLYDADIINSNIYAVYYTNVGGTKIALLDSSLTTTASITKAGEASTNGLSIFGDSSNNVWVVYNTSIATKGFIVNGAVTVTVLAPTVIDGSPNATNIVNVTGCYSSTQGLAFVLYDQSTSNDIFCATLTVGGVVTLSGLFLGSVRLNSKAWTINGVPHVVTIHSSNLQPTYFIGNIYNNISTNPFVANIAAKLAPDSAGTIPIFSILTKPNIIGSVVNLSLQVKGQISTSGPTGIYSLIGVSHYSLDFSQTNPSTVSIGNNLHIGTGQLVMYDGSNVVEHGFHIFPEGITATHVAAGSGLSAGQYGYKITYEWLDSKGQIHRSAPSVVTSVTVAAGDSVTLTIPYIDITNKSGVSVSIYRTAVNGSVYFKLSPAFIMQANNKALSTFNFTDTASDTSIQSNNQLYTTGEIENIAAPAVKSMSTFKSRIIIVPAEDQKQIWYSKQIVQGFPAEFSDVFIQNVEDRGGVLQATAQMDDKLILLKQDSVYYMNGDGPAASGANNDFTDPLFVTSDAGLQDISSIVVVPFGLMFKSKKGIYAIDRSLQARYMGSDVEGFNSNSVISSSLIPSANQVRFILNNATMLVFDYFYGQWSTFSNASAVSGCIYGGNHTFINSTGKVSEENSSSYTDGASAINMNFTTAWINLAGLQGFERFYFAYLLGKYISPHNLSIGIAFDYNSTIVQTISIVPDSTNSIEQWRVFPINPKCESFQITFTETNMATFGAGLTLSGLDLVVGRKKGYFTTTANQQAG